ncbi:type II toxin-antitoxin system Phd/YefM family antitoxin [Psychrobacter vallis]|uniref:type II toxin-antitoxin system Phd/YefM family antitoxin n=1 Tax=Psychrobacter vallis TaxID=248451 RepID=UPI00191A285B|nr:type II toxin-antitoxin system prevent-host-death family antitoxin [Psychrobacter vallis]
MKIISFSEAKRDFQAVLDTVIDDADPLIIGRQNDSDAVIMSLAHYNSLMETLYLLKSPANAAHLAESIAQYQAGKTTMHELVYTEDDSKKPTDGATENA